MRTQFLPGRNLPWLAAWMQHLQADDSGCAVIESNSLAVPFPCAVLT